MKVSAKDVRIGDEVYRKGKRLGIAATNSEDCTGYGAMWKVYLDDGPIGRCFFMPDEIVEIVREEQNRVD